MNILFLNLVKIGDINERGIYLDLMREFTSRGHFVYMVFPVERRFHGETKITDYGSIKTLQVKTWNIQKTNIIEKGIGTLLIEHQFYRAIKKHFANIRFDAVLYATPPITLVKPVRYIKERDQAKSFLLLKDIFPQNAVDLGMMGTKGIKGWLYKFFKTKEKQLYALSDHIGCMSRANVEYLLKNNPEIPKDKISVSPNSIEPLDVMFSREEKNQMRERYGIPTDKKVFLYGGNLGKPQDIPFVMECLRRAKDHPSAYFLVVGNGTSYDQLKKFEQEENLKNFKLMQWLPEEDYERMVAACDVGLIFLDHRFTTPNFPSRLLAYLQASLPVLACTDVHTDVGKAITEGNYGWWCESNNEDGFYNCVEEACSSDLQEMGDIGHQYLKDHYSVKDSCNEILNFLEK